MANTFKNSVENSIGTSPTTVYTTPSQTSTTVIGLSCANRIASNISVSVELTDTSEAKTVFLIKDTLITPGSSTVIIGGEQKVVLESGDLIRVTSTENSSVDVVVSVLEIT